MTNIDNSRRRLFAAAGVGLLLAGTDTKLVKADQKPEASKEKDEKEVGAVEDLMREHGVIRRALLVYRKMASKLRAAPASLDPTFFAALPRCSARLVKTIMKGGSKRRTFFRRLKRRPVRRRATSMFLWRSINEDES